MSSAHDSPEVDRSSSEAESSDSGETSIARSRAIKSEKTLKRKRRATRPSQFGATLQSLLGTEAPSVLPLSLKPSVALQRNDAKLEKRAEKLIQVEKKKREHRRRIKGVIEGWGAESERSLRKVAQRGVVKLFNTIQQSQLAAAAAETEAKAARGSGKPSLPAPKLDKDNKRKNRGKNTNANLVVDKDSFFDVIRSGGIVSKS